MCRFDELLLFFSYDTSSHILIGIDCALLIALIICIVWRRKQKFLYEISAQDQKRIQLDKRLSNPDYVARVSEGTVKRYPYSITYTDQEALQREFTGIYVGLRVNSERLKENFFTMVSSPIDIGRGYGCAVTIQDDVISERQCILFEDKGVLYVRNLAQEHTVILERDDDFLRLGSAAIQVENGDCLRMGTSYIEIEIRK